MIAPAGLLARAQISANVLYDPLEGMADAARRYGDVVGYGLGRVSVVQITHPDAIEAMLHLPAEKTRKTRVLRWLQELLGNGMLTADAAAWRPRRKLAAPSFTPKAIGHYAAVMQEETAKAVAGLPEGNVDVYPMILELTRKIAERTLFGDDVEVDGAAVTEALDVWTRAFHRRTNSFGRLFPERASEIRERTDAKKKLDEALFAAIRRRRALPDGDDLLGRLIASRGENDGSAFDDEDLRDEIVTLFVAGHETTALWLGYAIRALAAHPGAAARARIEADSATSSGPAALRGMAWTGAALDEVLRLRPPGFAVGRELVGDTDLAGVVLPAGTQVIAPTWVVHHDARWWADPQVFRPERWLAPEAGGDGTAALAPRGAFFPFGGGSRVCIGNHFAKMEALIVVAEMLRRFDLAPEPTDVESWLPSATIRPVAGVRVQLRRRGTAG